MDNNLSQTDAIKGIALLAIIIIFPIIFWMSLSTISAGEVGVVTLFGNVQKDTLEPGFHLLNPLSSVHKINLRVQTTKADSEAASLDLQMVHTSITLNYSLDARMAKPIYINLSSDLEAIEKSIIQPAMSEAFKQAVAEYSAENLIAKREVVSTLIQKLLQDRLKKYGILVSNISVTNFKFSEVFNSAIEQKMVAQQNIQTAQNKLDQAKVEAQQLVITAKAQADAMRVQQQAITPALLQKQAIEKWDGHLPTYTGGVVPFINIK